MKSENKKALMNTRRIVKRYESWRFYWVFFLLGFILISFLIFLFFTNPFLAKILGSILGSIWLVHLLMRFWYIFSNSYLTEDEILKVRHGIIFKEIIEIPIKDIEEVVFNQSAKEKLLGIGSLQIIGKDQNTLCVMYGIRDPEDMKSHILKVKNIISGKQEKS